MSLFKLFKTAPTESMDNLTQPQREAIADLLHFCLYADRHIGLAEERVLDETLGSFAWDPAVSLESYEQRSINAARRATETREARESYLQTIKARLTDPHARRIAIATAEKLLAVDGTVPAESSLLTEIKALLGS